MPNWNRSSFCSDHTCVEVSAVEGRILVRDSKHSEAPSLSFTRDEWTAFLRGAQNSEFDFDVLSRDR